jgi:sRNA-binding protein
MMQAERVEVLRQVNERKARLMAGPAEVLELKDQEDIARKKGTAAIAAASPAPQWMIEQNTVQQQIKDYADYGDGYSRATVDPDGSVMMEMMTEASDSRAPRKKGGTNALGLYVHDEDDYESEEDGEEGTDGDGTGGGTFQGVAAAAPKTEVYSQGYSEDEKERERLQKKAKKAKKKAKKNKKNKKKSKKKAKKQESESESHYSDEEYEDYAGGDNFDDRSYSDEESGSY